MESQTRYDLNAAIENWRAQLAAQPNLTAEVRRELETHLRDAIAGFQQRGLNDEESFWLACKRVGQPAQLGEEFLKANPETVWRDRIFWILTWVFFMKTLGMFTHYFPHFGLSNYTIIYTQLDLIIILVTGLLIVGTMRRNLSKMAWLINGRVRVAFIALTLILISASFNYHYQLLDRAAAVKMGLPGEAFPIFKTVAFYYIYPVFLAVLIVWLMPTQNLKTPKRA